MPLLNAPLSVVWGVVSLIGDSPACLCLSLAGEVSGGLLNVNNPELWPGVQAGGQEAALKEQRTISVPLGIV